MIGTMLGHYRILELQGRGGMGEVFVALDTRLNRRVALKVLRTDVDDDPDRGKRLRREARALAALRHPNVVVIHSVEETDGMEFITMELLEGLSLAEHIHRGGMPLDDFFALALPLSAGLGAAHRQGIVHRDLKPGNIIVEANDRPKIVDFGLARRSEPIPAAGEPHSLTTVTATIPSGAAGTLGYMAPEQLQGQAVDARTDIFSLGIVFYEMLCGERPFVADSDAEYVASVLRDPPRPLADLVPVTPRKLRAVIERCLEKDPGQRYPNGEALHQALVEARTAADAAPLPSTRRRAKWIPRLAWLASAVALALVVGGSAMWRSFQSRRSTANSPQAAIAVLGFQPAAGAGDAAAHAGTLDLVNLAVQQSSRCRVVSPAYLFELRRRRFGDGQETISEDQALTVARDAGATLLLAGTVGETGSSRFANWRLVDTRSGRTLGSQRAQATNLTALVDRVLVGVTPLISNCAYADTTGVPVSVAEITTSSPDAYAHYVAGLRAADLDQVEEAKRHFESAIALDSTFALAWYRLGMAHSYNSEQEIQRRFVDRAWALRAHLGIRDRFEVEARSDFLHGRFPESMSLYREMLDRWPDDRGVLRTVAENYSLTWFGKEARAISEKGLALYPNDPDLASTHLWSLLRSGDPQAATEVFRSKSRETPNESSIWQGLGDCFMALGEPDSAETAYRHMLVLDPSSFWARERLAGCTYARGDLEHAIESLEQEVARTTVPRSDRITVLTGGLMLDYFHSGRYRECLGAIDRALALIPDAGTQTRRRYQNHCASMLSLMGRGREALASCHEWDRKTDLDTIDRWEIEAQRTFAYMELGQLSAARASLAILRQSEPFSFGAYVIRTKLLAAEIELRDGRQDLCQSRLKEAEEPGIPVGSFFWLRHEWLACQSLAQAGQLDSAATAYRKLLASNGGFTLAHYELAQVEEHRGNRREAIAEYATCLRLWAHADNGVREVEDARRRMRQLGPG